MLDYFILSNGSFLFKETTRNDVINTTLSIKYSFPPVSNETNDPSIASYLNVLSVCERWEQETKSSDYPLIIKFQEEKRGQFCA